MDDQRCPLEECPGEAAEAAARRVPALAERLCEHRCVPQSRSRGSDAAPLPCPAA
ncbi:hypothetical protein DV515_00008737, partial [Chloebia gouldiae]